MQVRNCTDRSFKANCVVRGAKTPFQAITKVLERGLLEVRTQVAEVIPRGEDFVVIDGKTICNELYSAQRKSDISAILKNTNLPVIE